MEIREPIVEYGKKVFTIKEYLEREKLAKSKHEFYEGEIFAMAGASTRHNIIFSNVFVDIGYKLKGKPCRPFGSDMRIHIPENSLFTYPDISIFCGEPFHSPEDEDTIIQPVVLMEILSKSNREYDRNQKFGLYKAIPTLKEYITIDSEAVMVEAFRLNEQKEWKRQGYKKFAQSLTINTVGVSISLEEIYEGSKLTETKGYFLPF